mgnify:CR=1 FL=1|tara:strand:- start:3226 stop:3426 length:201 start_codon:yes stop_codon:yes gene_type:complete
MFVRDSDSSGDTVLWVANDDIKFRKLVLPLWVKLRKYEADQKQSMVFDRFIASLLRTSAKNTVATA